jgi:hypothetical protein
MQALRRVPAFLAGFAILAAFWASHNRFSRRFGLEDGTVTFLSLLLVAVILVYIFPLRILMASTMAFFTGGWAPNELKVQSIDQLRAIYVIYGAGFLVLSSIIAALNMHALRRAEELRLDAVERWTAISERNANAILGFTALLSITLASTLPMASNLQMSLPGFSYALLGVLMPIFGHYANREHRRLMARRATTP